MKKLIFTIALAVLAGSAFAQEMKKGYDYNIGTYERVTERGPYQTGSFFQNWFVGVAGGVNLYTSKWDNKADFGDRISPALDVTLGKWITPSFGFRAAYSGLSAKGAYNIHSTRYVRDLFNGELKDSYLKKQFDFWSVRGDILWNVSNAISGYRHTRTWDIIPFVGFGYISAKGKDKILNENIKRNNFAAYAGVLNDFRLGNVLSLTLEARYMLTKSDLDAYRGNSKADGMFSLTAGLMFNLGPREGFKRPEQPIVPDYTPYNQRIAALEGEVSKANDRISRLTRELEECLKAPKEVIIAPVEEIVPVADIHVFFRIGSTKIDNTEMERVETIAKAIKEASNTIKYSVTGYADAGTGTVAINDRLSHQRAQAVADALVTRFGVDRNQLMVNSKGGVRNHNDPKLDRVVIVAQE